MNQKKLSGLLILAGALAVIGVIFLFYGTALFQLVQGKGPRERDVLLLLVQMIMGLPYLLALRHYFAICRNIGNDRSFSRENAARMRSIARLLFLTSGLWAILMVAGAILGISPANTGFITAKFASAALYIRMGLALLATLAVALVSQMLALLLGKAGRLQEENDLTI